MLLERRRASFRLVFVLGVVRLGLGVYLAFSHRGLVLGGFPLPLIVGLKASQ